MASRRSGNLSESLPLVPIEVNHVEVAIGFQPIFVDLDSQGPNQAKTTHVIVEHPDDMGASLEHNPRHSRPGQVNP